MAQVLFVEDDQDDVFLIQRACQKAGVEEPKEFLSNGQVALEYLSGDFAKPLPKLVFLDLNMPIMGGMAFLNWFRRQPALATVPVVVLTTSENPQDMLNAYRSGANAYIVKPNSVSELAQMLTAAQQFWLKHNRIPN